MGFVFFFTHVCSLSLVTLWCFLFSPLAQKEFLFCGVVLLSLYVYIWVYSFSLCKYFLSLVLPRVFFFFPLRKKRFCLLGVLFLPMYTYRIYFSLYPCRFLLPLSITEFCLPAPRKGEGWWFLGLDFLFYFLGYKKALPYPVVVSFSLYVYIEVFFSYLRVGFSFSLPVPWAFFSYPTKKVVPFVWVVFAFCTHVYIEVFLPPVKKRSVV